MARIAEKPKEGIGARVERERIKKGWSQEDLAKLLNTTRSSIKNKELGFRPFSLEETKILCKEFHLTLDYLVNGTKTKNVSHFEAFGMSDSTFANLRYINNREHDLIKGIDMAFRSHDVLVALSRYMTYTPEDKGYYLSEQGFQKRDRFVECRMSQELFVDVLKQNLIHMIDNAKAGDYDATRHFEAYEDFTFADEIDAKLAEPSDYDDPGSTNKE